MSLGEAVRLRNQGSSLSCCDTEFVLSLLLPSLDPENDPLCVLLLIDFLSLRAREYTFLTRLFQEWEVSAQQVRGWLPGGLPTS